MFCPRCGAENGEDSTSCKSCGENLKNISNIDTKKKNNTFKTVLGKKKPLIFLIIVLIIGIIAYLGYISYMNENFDQAYKMSYYYQKHWDSSLTAYNQSIEDANAVIYYRKEMVKYATSNVQKDFATKALKYAQNLKEIRTLKSQIKTLEYSDDYSDQSMQEQNDYLVLADNLNATEGVPGLWTINDSKVKPYESTLKSKYPLVVEDDKLNNQLKQLESEQTELTNGINLIFVQNPDFKSHIETLMDEVNG